MNGVGIYCSTVSLNICLLNNMVENLFLVWSLDMVWCRLHGLVVDCIAEGIAEKVPGVEQSW